nr:hypothetical protein GCM10020093_084620 [Planobispora longispora]
MIDRESYTPVHQQVADILRARIDQGELAPGEKLASEGRLAQEFEVGRDTIRDAIAVLRAEGRIVTERRVGSWVREPRQLVPVDVVGPARVTAHIPSPEERRRLGVGQGVAVLRVEREGQEPMLLAGIGLSW